MPYDIQAIYEDMEKDLRWALYEVIDNNKSGQTIHIAKRMFHKYFGDNSGT